jgi:hypothetical protein
MPCACARPLRERDDVGADRAGSSWQRASGPYARDSHALKGCAGRDPCRVGRCRLAVRTRTGGLFVHRHRLSVGQHRGSAARRDSMTIGARSAPHLQDLRASSAASACSAAPPHTASRLSSAGQQYQLLASFVGQAANGADGSNDANGIQPSAVFSQLRSEAGYEQLRLRPHKASND